MPDYQTSEGMAIEPYVNRLRELGKTLHKIKRLCDTPTASEEQGKARIRKIRALAKKALG